MTAHGARCLILATHISVIGIAMFQYQDRKVWGRLGRVEGLGILTWLSGIYPAIVFLLVFFAWATAWAQLGNPPQYSVDDPNRISFFVSSFLLLLYTLGILSLVAAFASALLWLIGLISRILQRDSLWPAVIPVLAWTALLVS